MCGPLGGSQTGAVVREGWKGGIPTAATAVLNLNATANIKNAAVKKIYVEAGLKWLEKNIQTWEEIFKYQ